MKRKISSLSHLNYKRRCSILKEDMNKNTNDCESSSDEELLIRPFKRLCKSDENCTISTEKNDENQMYSSKSILDSSSDDDIDEDIDNCCSEKAGSKKTSENSPSSSKLNGSTSFEKDDTQYRLGVLKGIFKDDYTEEKLLNAISDTNGLDHAVSVLIESNNEKGGNQQSSKQLTNGDVSSHNELTNEAQSELKNNNSEHSSLSDDESVEQDLATLMKQFPECDKDELQNVLEANSFCVEDAIAAMEMFASPEKNIQQKSKHRKKKYIDFDEVVDCVVIDDNSDVDESISPLSAPSEMSRSTQAITIISDDCNDDCNDDVDDNDNVLDCDPSDREQDLAMSAADKASLLSFLDSADPTELALVRGCSITKAEKIRSLRPFITWNDLLKRVRNTKGLNEELLWECQTFVNERDKMEDLMDKCEHISTDIKDLFEVKSSDTENVSENEISTSMLVTKEQYVTKEPSLVAPGCKLKSYQLTGLNWLIAIHKFGLNGILADEMGLGKTIQAIVFLAYLIEQEEKGPHLIIVPSSTCENWKRELERWCPSITYLHYTGSPTERAILRDEVLDSRLDFQVLLTTYSMATSSVSDRMFLKKTEFHYAIFDEAHMLKNMKTQRYQQLLRIKPQRMLMLTGTPIQNNLLELMSLLTFVMPDMFAERVEGIKLLFGDSKVKHKEETAYQKEKVTQAKQIMEPFVMRRVKKDVLGDSLPEKREHIVECDVPSRQRKVYDEHFNSCCKIMHSAETKAQMQGMAFLIELRKAANHSLLIRSYYTDDMLSEMARKYCKDPSHRDSEVNFVFEDMQVMSDFELRRLCLGEHCLKDFHLPHELIMDSGKFLYLDSILPKMKERGDRVLLFNQFTMTMDIVEVYLQTRGYKYLRFDGQTSVDARQGLIDRFNTEEDIFIFILSTKAGGLGINLTSANVVILYDSDYNPHNDKQAEDRCHRLGQTRQVNIHRLVCKDTIERTILKCANAKIQLHEDISGNGNSDKGDIQGLVNAVFGSATTKQEEKQ